MSEVSLTTKWGRGRVGVVVVLYRQRNNNNNNNNLVKNKSFSRTMITVFFSACSFFLTVQNLKNKSHSLTHALTHTHAQLPLSESVLNMFVSLQPNPSRVQISLSGRGASAARPPHASSLVRARGFSGGN